MKVFIPNFQPDRVGGGWSFCNNISKGLGDSFTLNYEEATHFLIAGASMVEREDVLKAKQDGKLIVARFDNALRPSRNRGTGMTRMKDFADICDLAVYQSEWARKFLYPFTKKDGVVILNGVDTSIYNDKNRHPEDNTFLYARSSRDEGKQWINAWYWYVEQYAKEPSSMLEIVGKFSGENLDWNFDFYNGERYRFLGQQPNLIDAFKRNKYFLYSFTNDAASNTLLEARASGCEIVDVNFALSSGGAKEIMDCKDISVERMISEYKEVLSVLV